MILKTKDDMHIIHLELGETLQVTFDPAGVNAVADAPFKFVGLLVGTVQLGSEAGLSILPNEDHFYEGTYSGSNVKGWYVYANHGYPESITFAMSEPGTSLELKRLEI